MGNNKPNVSFLRNNLFHWCKPMFTDLYDWIAKSHSGKNSSSSQLLRKILPNQWIINDPNIRICSVSSNLTEHTQNCFSFALIILYASLSLPNLVSTISYISILKPILVEPLSFYTLPNWVLIHSENSNFYTILVWKSTKV